MAPRRAAQQFLMAGIFVVIAVLAAQTEAWSAETAVGSESRLHLSTRVRTSDPLNQSKSQVRFQTVDWDPRQTAIVVCDMWDDHHCQGAARRVAEMAPRMNEVLHAARTQGVLIIHCPSDCMEFYKDTPQRKLAQSAPVIETTIPLVRSCRLDKDREGILPIDDSDGGCDCTPKCPTGHPWTRQIATLDIAAGDAITDSVEAFYLMRQRGITNVIVMGVHTNMCVLARPFSIRQMVYQGQNVVLMRDMTDTMYNSQMRPFVSHFQGTDLVIDHIERHWCPTITSADFTGRAPFAFAEDKRPHVVAMIGEDEYRTWETLPQFAAEELAPRGVRVTVIHADDRDKNHFPGLSALESADLMLLSVRRRTPRAEELALVRKYLQSGKPMVGIRTASHAFAVRGGKEPPAGYASWQDFDPEVLGGHYVNHYGNDVLTSVTPAPGVGMHPILAGISTTGWQSVASLYFADQPLVKTATPLLIGEIPGKPAEPIAWTNTYHGGRVFYTSLGHVEDFSQPVFRRMLTNAIFWALERDGK